MMNVLALCLVLSSIVSGGFFSPPQQQENKNNVLHRDDLIVKEANRIIMVEYEREAQPRDTSNYPSPPSPPPPPPPPPPSLLEEKLNMERSIATGVRDSAKKKLKEASSVLPNIGQGLSDLPPIEHHYNPKELICDAYGRCKHKLAGVFGKAKEGASEKIHDIDESGEKAMDKAKETLSKAKDSMYERAHGVEEVGETAKEKTKEAGETLLGKSQEAGEMAKEKTKEELGTAKESVYETGESVIGKTKEGLEKAKESVSEKANEVKEKGKEAGDIIWEDLKKGHHSLWDERTIKEKAGGLYEEVGRNFTKFLHRGRQVFYDAANHVVSKEVVHPTMGVVHLLGLATAYGISVWVTFMSSHVLAGALPRQQFGIVQSKIYPVYFGALLGSIGCALLAHALRNPNWGLKTYQAYNMLVALGLVLFNLLYLEPQATKVMFDKMKLEKEEGRWITGEAVGELVEPVGATPTAATATTTATTTTTEDPSARDEDGREVKIRLGVLNKRLESLNSISSLLNVLTLMALTWQLVYLGRRLPVT